MCWPTWSGSAAISTTRPGVSEALTIFLRKGVGGPAGTDRNRRSRHLRITGEARSFHGRQPHTNNGQGAGPDSDNSATSVHEADRRYRQSSALLGLARALAAAGTSAEVARRHHP